MQDPFLAIYILAGLILALIGLAAWAKNSWIRWRLRLSLVVLAVSMALWLVIIYDLLSRPEDAAALNIIATLLAVGAVINAVVALTLNPFRGEGVSEKWPSIVQDAFVLIGIVLVGIFLAREQFVALGVASSLVLGFALKDTLGNLFAGLALQSEKPFHVGDWVQVAQVEGRVLEVTWRATKLRTKSGNFVIIPNSVISMDRIVNYSKPSPVMRMEKVIPMGFSIPPNQFKKVVLDTMADVPEILTEPRPDVLTNEYDDFSIKYRCRFWIADFGRSEPIIDKFATLVYYRLQRYGLGLPVPVRDVQLTERVKTEDEGVSRRDPRIEFVEKVDLFARLDPEVREMIAQGLEGVTFASSEPIIHQDAPGDSMFFIRSGTVRIVLEKEGVTNEVAVLEPGQYFGEMALLTGEPRSAGALAAGDVHAFILHKDSFRDVLLHDETIAEQISTLMASRREGLEESSAELASRASSQKKVQSNFLSRIQKFFGL